MCSSDLKGIRETQVYLVEEVQKVYRDQGVSIHDKHIEIIVRQMTRRVGVQEPGDTDFLPGERVDSKVFRDTNRRIFEALKPGGYYIVADHSAKAGDGTTVGRTMHRIEEAVVRRDVEAAGFRFVASGDFLRNPEDKRDVTVFKSPVPVDEFFLKFQKPE